MKQLEVRSLCKSYDESQPVLNSITFSVDKGEFLVILGASGCGKTTLLRSIAGLEIPDSGSIILAGKDITNTEPADRDVAMVFQNYALYPHMSVFDNLAFSLKIRKFAKAEIARQVHEAARLLKLSDYLNRKPAQLSGGQRQRVALGRALVRKPALFLFDEPLSNLDAELRSQMRAELAALHKKIGATSIYVTHDQVEAMTLSDRIIILHDGFQIGPEKPRELYDNPPDIKTAAFLGNPGMNLMKVTVDESDVRLVVDAGCKFSVKGEVPGCHELYFGFRPEHTEFSDQGEIPVAVSGIEDTGREYLLQLKGPSKTIIFCISRDKKSIGEKGYVKISRYCFFDVDSGQQIKIGHTS